MTFNIYPYFLINIKSAFHRDGDRITMTIYDIAEKCGYSIATISKVLNNYPGVSEKAKKVVNAVIEETGYSPSHYARTLATQRSWIIGILFSEERELGIINPHFNKILQSFQQQIGEFGYDTLFLQTNSKDEKRTLLDRCLSRGVDGVLIAGGMSFNDEVSSVIESDLPKVSVETIYKGVDTVISDNRLGSMQALEHLYLLGHRKIALITSDREASFAAKVRYNTYSKFHEKKNLEINPNFFVEAKKYTKQAGEEAVEKLLAQCWEDMPTAIYAAYDEYVAAAVKLLTNQGFRIPEDISIIGFDDLPLCEYVTPSITTIRQNRNDIGKEAAKVLNSIILGDISEFGKVTHIPTTLVIRETTRKLKE